MSSPGDLSHTRARDAALGHVHLQRESEEGLEPGIIFCLTPLVSKGLGQDIYKQVLWAKRLLLVLLTCSQALRNLRWRRRHNHVLKDLVHGNDLQGGSQELG